MIVVKKQDIKIKCITIQALYQDKFSIKIVTKIGPTKQPKPIDISKLPEHISLILYTKLHGL